MNEFTAKKLGEVYAFITLVLDTYHQGNPGFSKVFDEDTLKQRIVVLASLRDELAQIVEGFGQSETMQTKSERTLSKITRARDEYIDGRWDNLVELYEWFSFNAGAGGAHASEVVGASTAINNAEMIRTTKQIEAYFDDLLIECKEFLYKIGVASSTT